MIRSGKGESSVGKPGVNDNFMADEGIDSVEDGATGAIGSGSMGGGMGSGATGGGDGMTG